MDYDNDDTKEIIYKEFDIDIDDSNTTVKFQFIHCVDSMTEYKDGEPIDGYSCIMRIHTLSDMVQSENTFWNFSYEDFMLSAVKAKPGKTNASSTEED